MDSKSYEDGKTVGWMIAAARSASSFSTNFKWHDALPEADKKNLEDWAALHGMVMVFDDKGTSMVKADDKPKLSLVKS